MPAPPKFSVEEIGPALLAARAAGVPWKLLERKYELSRQRLWQLMQAAEGEDLATNPPVKNVN